MVRVPRSCIRHDQYEWADVPDHLRGALYSIAETVAAIEAVDNVYVEALIGADPVEMVGTNLRAARHRHAY